MQAGAWPNGHPTAVRGRLAGELDIHVSNCSPKSPDGYVKGVVIADVHLAAGNGVASAGPAVWRGVAASGVSTLLAWQVWCQSVELLRENCGAKVSAVLVCNYSNTVRASPMIMFWLQITVTHYVLLSLPAASALGCCVKAAYHVKLGT